MSDIFSTFAKKKRLMTKDSKAMTCKDLVSFSTEVGNHDTRIDRCKRHEGRTIVFITLCAVLCGWRTWDEICEFGKYKKHIMEEYLGELVGGIDIKDHMFAYPERKDTIKACVYVKELVRFILWNVEKWNTPPLTPPLKGAGSGYALYNCTFEPAYTIEQIVTAMKKVTGLTQWVPYIPNSIIMPMAVCAKMVGSPMGICPARVKKLQISTNICGQKMAWSGYKFKWMFEEALADWFEDNNGKCLE